MSKLTILLVLSIASAAYALHCYTCENTECDDTSKLKSINCNSVANVEYRCLKKVVRDTSTKMMNTTRKCAIIKNDQDRSACEPSPSKRYEIVTCDICREDLCNSATGYDVNFAAFAGAVFAAAAARIFVH